MALINVLSPTMMADFLPGFNSNRFLKITRSIFSKLFKSVQSQIHGSFFKSFEVFTEGAEGTFVEAGMVKKDLAV